jgi:vanillate O-demethylase monooxygenase subunit
MGKLCDGGDALQCPYHGLRFDAEGKCVHNPHGGGAIPKAAVVRSYPVVERESVVWIWMGDPEKADPAVIPSFDFLDARTWGVGTGYMSIEAPYELETDNILDLSHIEFMHPLFATEAVRRGQVQSTQEGETVWSRRFIVADELPEFLQQAFQIPTGSLADRWLDVRWNAPAQMALWSGGVVTGRPREEGVNTSSAHMFTPETRHRTHYFYAMSFPRALGPHVDALAQQMVQVLRGPFEFEDKPIIEAVARRMGAADFWALNPVLLAGDSAAVRARRVLRQKMESEKET